MSESKTITTYVRKSSNETRTINFRYDSIPKKELIAKGCAIDGNTASIGVGPSTSAGRPVDDGLFYSSSIDSDSYLTLSQALHAAESLLIDMLEEYGYEVEFA